MPEIVTLLSDVRTDAEGFERCAAGLALAAERALVEPGRDWQELERLVQALFGFEERLRQTRVFAWQGLLDLLKARFALAVLAFAHGERNAAFAAATAATRWLKDLLSEAEIEADEDFDRAGLVVLCGSSLYLLAHRFIEPESSLLRDLAPMQDFMRTTNRVFQSEALASRLKKILGLTLSSADLALGLRRQPRSAQAEREKYTDLASETPSGPGSFSGVSPVRGTVS